MIRVFALKTDKILGSTLPKAVPQVASKLELMPQAEHAFFHILRTENWKS